MSDQSNPRAFPSAAIDPAFGGMDLRDWLAGQALAGIMGDKGMRPASTEEFSHLAARLYQLADAMIAERVKGGAI